MSESKVASAGALSMKASATPPPQVDTAHKDFASRHRVKKLLETYNLTADRSLMGPEASEEALNQQKYYHNSYSAHSSAFKLPPDVELSKTSPPEHEHDFNRSARVDFEASKRLQMQMVAAVQAGLKGGKPLGSPPPQIPGRLQATNGLATLSRIDGNGFSAGGSSASTAVADASSSTSLAAAASSGLSVVEGYPGHQRSRSHSDPRHLTGEMIRQINALQKKQGGPNAAALAATIADYQRQQLQMQATYEKVLREKSYLKTGSNKSQASVGPVFSARDRGGAKLSETRLATRNIACFEVGGEKRCCLPQILNSVLDQISLQAIHSACDELQIFCSTCTNEQLDVLKLSKIIPNTATQCGLITKSDAERLCSRLLDNQPPVASMMGFHATASPFSFRVQHECFGKCRGIVLPEAYTSPSARCIECLECEGLFCPAKFVCHSHRNRENRTCHWGFDSAHWRAYLHLADDYTEMELEKLGKTVQDFKSRYHQANGNGGVGPGNNGSSTSAATITTNKRKADSSYSNGGRDRSLEAKSPRHLDGPPPPKKRTSDEFQPQMFSGEYGLFLYQTWAASLAGNGKGASQMHPAAFTAWSQNYAQAIKDGKLPAPPGGPGGMPPPRPSSSAGHNGSYHRDHRSGASASGGSTYEAKLISPVESRSYVKSSPLSEPAESPSDHHRLAHQNSIDSSGGSRSDLVSPSQQRRPSKHSPSSLAEDILAIRAALDGASAVARERTLKILERLTARLAMAESERDMALDQLKKLQRRFESKEEELHKKRAELREALRNDAVVAPAPGPGSNSREIEFTTTSGSGSGSKKFTSSVTSLPKMELKSPARVMEEKSCESSSSRSATPPISASALHAASQAAVASSAIPASPSIESLVGDSTSMKLTSHLRRRSGTPASIKSRESEDVRERLMSMEAELRALRDELSNRSSLASNTSSQATVKDKEESTTQPARPPSGTESETKKAQECCPEQIDKNDPLSPPPQAKKAKITEDDKESDEKQKPDENKT